MDVASLRVELERSGVVLVVRLESAEQLDNVVATAAAAGVKLVEITATTAGGIDWLAANTAEYPDVMLGVGTVTDDRIARTALDAGAEFLVSPNVDLAVLETAAATGTACMPGAFTSTEVVTAFAHGAAAIKLFPVTQLGPGYVRDLKAPLPQIPLVPIGGIDERNAADYIRAGGVAVGVGAAFVNDRIVADGDWLLLRKRLGELIGAVEAAREPVDAAPTEHGHLG